MEKCFHVCYLVVFLILVGSTSSKGQKVLLFFFSFKMLLVFQVEGAVISWARFQALWSIGEPVFYILV